MSINLESSFRDDRACKENFIIRSDYINEKLMSCRINTTITKIKKIGLTLICLIPILSQEARPQASIGYKLGPDDRLLIKVWDLRNNDPYQWMALTGEFSVGSDGDVSLPIIGPIHADGLNVTALSQLISSTLQNRVGLSARPEASVQIIKYRPFYITGAVKQPGKYEYVPGLTVLQAVSIAAGVLRAPTTEIYGFQREVMNAGGENQILKSERLGLLVRQTRLKAEIENGSELKFPKDLQALAPFEAVAEATRNEISLFEAWKSSRQEKTNAIVEAKKVLQSQVSSLSQKEQTLSRQLDLTRKDLVQVNELVSKGMVINQRKLGAEQSVSSFESSALDVQIARLKTQQDLSQLERDLIELNYKYKSDALAESADVKTRLEINLEKSRLSNIVKAHAIDAIESASGTDENLAPTYTLNRPSKQEKLKIGEDFHVLPGDVITVELPRTSRSGSLVLGSPGNE